MKAVIMSFSLRDGGNCEGILSCVHEVLKGMADVVSFERPRITPCGGCGYRCFGEPGCPYDADDAQRMYEAVCQSELAVYIVPNYCDYPNACFFAFNERGQSFFQEHDERYDAYLRCKKLFLAVSNTEKENFERAFSYHVPPDEKPEILFLRAQQYGSRSIDGNLMEAPEAREAIARFVRKAVEFSRADTGSAPTNAT
ncbi:MAG: hypothetical protein ABFC62_03955 [Clostridiaceae bacterium]